MLKTYTRTVTSNEFIRWQYTRSSTEASDSVHNSFNVSNMYFLKLQSIHHQNYAIVNLQSSLSLLQTNFACSFPGVFIAFKTKNPTLPKLITKKTIFQKENKRYSSEINMSEKFAEETHQAKEFSRQSRNLREREKTSIKSRELNRNNRSKAIHTQSLPPVAASISRR